MLCTVVTKSIKRKIGVLGHFAFGGFYFPVPMDRDAWRLEEENVELTDQYL